MPSPFSSHGPTNVLTNGGRRICRAYSLRCHESQRLTESRAQAFTKMPADTHFGLVAQDGHIVAVRILAQFDDDIDVDDGRSMDTHEPPFVEHFVQGTEQTAMKVFSPVASMQLHVDAVRFDPADLLDWEEPDSMESLHENLVDSPLFTSWGRTLRDERGGSTLQ